MEMWDKIPDDGQDSEESSSGDDDVFDSEYIQRSDADESTSGDGDVVDDENIELNIEKMGESRAESRVL